jgi:hypothetical protein
VPRIDRAVDRTEPKPSGSPLVYEPMVLLNNAVQMFK